MSRRLDDKDYELIVNQYFIRNADVETISDLLGRSPEVIQVDLTAILLIRDQNWDELYEFFSGGTWVPKNLLTWGQEYFGTAIPDNIWIAQRDCRKNAKNNYGPKSCSDHEDGICLEDLQDSGWRVSQLLEQIVEKLDMLITVTEQSRIAQTAEVGQMIQEAVEALKTNQNSNFDVQNRDFLKMIKDNTAKRR